MCRDNEFISTDGECVLLVDDELAVVKMTRKKLEKLGYQVRCTTDPVKALQWVQSQPNSVDLIITDMVMPLMSGAELAKALLEIRPDLPIILCTGYSVMSEEDALDIGICKFVSKPFELDVLARHVRQAIDGE